MSAHGTYEQTDGKPAVRFVRELRHPRDAVWRMVTDPAELAHWFPCEVQLDEPRAGAPMRFVFSPDFALDGEVLECEPPARFSFRWGEDVLAFTLDEHAGGTRLTMLHLLNEEGAPAASKTAAGWHLCLDALGERLDGRTPDVARDGRPTPEWRARYEEYQAAGVPSGAEVPEGLNRGQRALDAAAVGAVHLDLPDRRLRLHAVDDGAGAGEGLAAVRGARGDDHARLPERRRCPSGAPRRPRRARGARPPPRRSPPASARPSPRRPRSRAPPTSRVTPSKSTTAPARASRTAAESARHVERLAGHPDPPHRVVAAAHRRHQRDLVARARSATRGPAYSRLIAATHERGASSIAASRSATVAGSGSSTSTCEAPARSRRPAKRRTETTTPRV